MPRKINRGPNPRSNRLGLEGFFDRTGTVPIGIAKKLPKKKLRRLDKGKKKFS